MGEADIGIAQQSVTALAYPIALKPLALMAAQFAVTEPC